MNGSVYVKIKMFLIVVVVAVLFFLSYAKSEEFDTYTMYVVVDSESVLNGRAKPSAESEIVAIYNLGNELKIISIENGWANVIGSEYGTCYVFAKYLSYEKPFDEGVKMIVVSNGRVAIREEPDKESIIEKWVNNGDELFAFASVNGFYKVDDGYIMCEFLK